MLDYTLLAVIENTLKRKTRERLNEESKRVAAGLLVEYRDEFQDPGGKSALRRATKQNPRTLPCPTCKEPNRLTPKDAARGYQCDKCADRDEGGFSESESLSEAPKVDTIQHLANHGYKFKGRDANDVRHFRRAGGANIIIGPAIGGPSRWSHQDKKTSKSGTGLSRLRNYLDKIHSK